MKDVNRPFLPAPMLSEKASRRAVVLEANEPGAPRQHLPTHTR